MYIKQYKLFITFESDIIFNFNLSTFKINSAISALLSFVFLRNTLLNKKANVFLLIGALTFILNINYFSVTNIKTVYLILFHSLTQSICQFFFSLSSLLKLFGQKFHFFNSYPFFDIN